MLDVRFNPVEEVASAGFVHDLRARVAGELAESIRAVDDGDLGDLCIAEHKVAVC